MEAKFQMDHELWQPAQDVWNSWGVELLVLASFLFHIILTILGRQRKYRNHLFLDLILWCSYFLAYNIGTLALGKLTAVTVQDNKSLDYNIILKGFLAPLLLMHLSFPDSMTAYSLEDNRLGMRQILNLVVTILFVISILRCSWNISLPVSWLCIPLFIGGIIKPVSTVLAHKFANDDIITTDEINIEEVVPGKIGELHETFKLPQLGTILLAYYRFKCLRPHLVGWSYHPDLTPRQWMSTDSLLAKDAFTMIEVELGFLFDVLYSKAPIIYTELGLISRFFSFLCLASTSIGFFILSRNVFSLNMHVTYTCSLLIGATLIELYQIALLPFSDWAIIYLCKRPRKLLISRVLPFVVSMSTKQKRWSNIVQQLDLMQYCLNGQPPKLLNIVAKLFCQEEKLKRCWVSTQEIIPLEVKEVIIDNIRRLDSTRHFCPFNRRGQWTLETYNIRSDMLLYNFETSFDKSIIIWHVATDILIELDNEASAYRRASKLLSHYMMYLLARRPHMLSVTTAYITLDYASSMLEKFVKGKGPSEQRQSLLSEAIKEPVWTDYKDTLITRKWNLLEDVQNLARDLSAMSDKWVLISSVWVEMLCYAAYNCPVQHHTEMLRRGGELVTHVWLLLAHKTETFPIIHTSLKDIQLRKISPAFNHRG